MHGNESNRLLRGASSVLLMVLTLAAAAAQPAPAVPPPAGLETPLVTPVAATQVAQLTGADQVPPVAATGSGTAWIELDPHRPNIVRWTVQFTGLTGPATGAHIHGPAQQGENAAVILDLTLGGTEATSPIEGEATLTDEQVRQLTSGQWYVNIHTAAYPNGEIRGQLMPCGCG